MIGNSPEMEKLKSRFLAKKSDGYILEGQSNQINLDLLSELALSKRINEVYCSASAVNQREIEQLLSLTLHYGINIHVVSDVDSADDQNLSADKPFLLKPELNLEKFPLIDTKNLIFKRIFDIVFSLIVIVTILWWVTIILGLIIKLESKGPIFFKQPRAGRGGQYFACLKFRSMTVNGIEKQATRHDNRITKVGRFIRKTSIDELPQFINVFLGQMSVVGPRPHIKLLNDQYGTKINNYDERMLVKPGITGLSQVSGLRGETAGKSSMAHRVKVDMIYIKNWSFLNDATIILKTIFDVLFLKNKNVY